MKKSRILTLAALSVFSFAATSHAQVGVPSVAPYTKTTAVQPPGDKQQAQRLDDCETQAQQQNIPDSQVHSFLNDCTKKKLASGSYGKPTSTPPSTLPTAAPTSTISPGTPSRQ
jgi:hypothetical protein